MTLSVLGRWFAGPLAGLLTLACSNERTQPPELAGVYERIHAAREDYEAGIRMLLVGDDVLGENQLRAATTRVVVAIRECSGTPGCDAELFTVALEQLVAEERSARLDGDVQAGAGSGKTRAATLTLTADLLPPQVELSREGPSLLTGADLPGLIPLNSWVKAALNDWLTWDRPALMAAYRNYGFMQPEIEPVYRQAGLPEALLFAMIAKESGGKVHAYSRAGAAGPLQFMYRTGLRYGLGEVDGFDRRLDPLAATAANARYMKDLLRLFDGNLELALAAYNLGDGRLRDVLRRHGLADFWDPELRRELPQETRDYVPQVLAAAWLFLHPEAHGLEFPAFDAPATEIELAEAISLGELSICLGHAYAPEGWFRTLRNLNPSVSATDRVPAGSELRLPTPLVSVYSEHCTGEASLLILARDLHDSS